MRRYLGLLVALWGAFLIVVCLLMGLPRQGAGWHQLGSDEGVIFSQNYNTTPRRLSAFVLQGQRARRIFTTPPNDCASLSENGQTLVISRDDTMQATAYDVWRRSHLNTFTVTGRASLCPHMVETVDAVTFFGGNSQTDRYRISTGERFDLPPLTLPEPPPQAFMPSRDIDPTVGDSSGRYLFYSRCLEEGPVVGCDDNWAYVIYNQQLDQVVTTLPDADHSRLSFAGRLYYPALWSPDSRYLLYPATSDTSSENTTTRLHMYDLSTNIITVLEPTMNGFLILPRWSPDSTRLQFILDPDILSGSLFGDDARLVVYDLTSQTWVVSSGTYNVLDDAVWSPNSDGLLVVIADITGETAGLLIHMNASTGQITTLARNVTDLHSWFVTPP